jgi:MYXO-CTERM domain-containing protein
MYINLAASPPAPSEINVSGKYPAIKAWHGASVSGLNLANSPQVSSSWASKSTIALARDNNRWSLELQIPYTTVQPAGNAEDQLVYLPETGEFKAYVNVLSTNDSGVSLFVNQRPWPQSQPLLDSNGFGEIEQNTPDVANWGIVKLDGAFTTAADPAVPTGAKVSCAGVEIKVGDFGVRNGLASNDGHQIRAMPGPGTNGAWPVSTNCSARGDSIDPARINTFWAKPKNLGTTAAMSVSADFYVADWGISNNWSKIGSLGAPAGSTNGTNATGTSTIPTLAAGQSLEVTNNWTLTEKQSCLYMSSNSAHHCMQVVLNSTDPKTSFSKVSASDNFGFTTLSTFERPVVLSTKNMGPVPAGLAAHQMILESRSQVIDYKPDGKTYYANTAGSYIPPSLRAVPGENFAGPITSAQLWTVEGHLLNGHKLIINGKSFEDADYVGAFGYLGGHNGQVQRFTSSLSGAGLSSPRNGIQTAQIPANSDLVANSKMEAVEPSTDNPPCPCQCNDVSCRLKCNLTVANGGGTLSTSLAFVGALGAGGFAFLRRRRSQKLSDLVERSKD